MAGRRLTCVSTVALVLALLAAVLAPAAALAAAPTFGQPTATADLGEPVTISSQISGDDITSVDAIIHLAGNATAIVLPARQLADGTWQAQQEIDIASSAGCACLDDGQSAPNTHFDFHFRVTSSDGTTADGPIGASVVEDTRFSWQTLSDRLVVVHWYAGDQAFGQSAANVANGAIDKASELLGVTLDKPVDLYVYDTEDDMRSAISPGRENVAGEAHPDIDTMYVWIPANEAADEFAGTLIRHELTHLVFHRAVDNEYHGVPRWLDEGVAVYLSEGYTDYWKGFVDGTVTSDTLIPLQGLAGLFPSVKAEFYLAYGEAVAGVDYFVRTYGEPKLWELVNSYSKGVSDDDAFSAATGADVEAFNTAWFESLGLQPQDPFGPQPGAPGPIPTGWTDGNEAPATTAPSAGPGATPAPGTTPAPALDATARSTPTFATGALPGQSAGGSTDIGSIFLILLLVVALMIGTLAVGLVVRNRMTEPPRSGPS